MKTSFTVNERASKKKDRCGRTKYCAGKLYPDYKADNYEARKNNWVNTAAISRIRACKIRETHKENIRELKLKKHKEVIKNEN